MSRRRSFFIRPSILTLVLTSCLYTCITLFSLDRFPNNLSSADDSPFYLNISSVNYIIQPESIQSECSRGRLWLLMVVHSAVSHTAHRRAIRRTWGSVTGLDNRQIRLIFLLGITVKPEEQDAVSLEATDNQDILQGDFLDTYLNLTYKNLMGLRWASEECGPELSFVWKSDDDVFLNLFGLYAVMVERLSEITTNTMACLTTVRSVVHRRGRYAVSRRAYPAQFYPEHCVGMAYLVSSDAVRALHRISHTVPFMSPDDAFIGVLRVKSGVNIHRLNYIYGTKADRLDSCIQQLGRDCQLFVGPVGDPEKLPDLWNKNQG